MTRVAGVLVAAGCYAVACPPIDWSLAAWLVPGLLLTSVRGASPRRAFALAVPFSLALGWAITGWLRHASLAYFGFDEGLAAAFAVAVWVGYGVVPFGILLACWAVVAPRASARLRPWAGAWLWVAMELGRTHLFTGLPWELLGHTQYRNLVVAQIAELGGVYAVSFLVALVSLAGAEALAGGLTVRERAGRLAPAIGALALVLTWGLASARTGDGDGASVRIALVQGSVPNEFRWKRAFVERNLGVYSRLTRRATDDTPDLIVWPENAVDLYLDREPMVRSQIAPLAGRARWGLLLGGPRLLDDGSARNSAYLLAATGEVGATYDKRRLVPFAEYDPFGGDSVGRPDEPIYTPGTTDAPLPVGALRLGTTICYEILFPGLVRELVRQGADVLVNLANDSWLDDGAGVAPDQHLSMAVFRAIETRRYLVRASASGTSAFVDPGGGIYDRLPRGSAGALVAAVRPRTGLTPYVRWGDWWVAVVAALLLVVARPWEHA